LKDSFCIKKISFEEYAAEMNESKTWGDYVEILAISELYSRPVQTPLKVKGKGYTISKSYHEDYAGTEETLRIIYSGRNHYDALKRKSGKII